MGEFRCGSERVCFRTSRNSWKVNAAAGHRRGDNRRGRNDGNSQASKCATAFWMLADLTSDMDFE